MSTVSTVNKYKKRADFSDEVEYRKYVQSVITPGVKVMRTNGAYDPVSCGETGVVTQIDKHGDCWFVYADYVVGGRIVHGALRLCEHMVLVD